MLYIYMAFSLSFMLGLLGLAFHRSHLLSALLCLEGTMLSLYLGVSLWTSHMALPSFAIIPMLILTFSACEAGTGLALMVATTRTHGTDNLQNLNLLKC